MRQLDHFGRQGRHVWWTDYFLRYTVKASAACLVSEHLESEVISLEGPILEYNLTSVFQVLSQLQRNTLQDPMD